MIARIFGILQAIAIASAVDGIAEQEILKAQIHKLIDEHKHELMTLSNIYELCEKLHFQQGLLDQLKKAQLYSVKQWEIIGRSMNQQLRFFNDFMTKFKDISLRAHATKFEWLNGLTLGIYFFSFVEKAYQTYKGAEKPNPPPPELLSYESIAELRVQSGEGHIVEHQQLENTNSSERVNQMGSCDSGIIDSITQHGAVRQNLTRSRFQGLKDWINKPGVKFVAQYGVRILMLAFSVVSYVLNRIDIAQLLKQFSEAQQFFGQKGGFKQKEEKVATALLALSANIFTLSSLSHSVVSELQNIFLIRSAVEPVNANYYFKKATETDSEKFGLNADFHKSCDQMVKQVNKICSSTKDIVVKLDELHEVFKPFIQQGNVTKVFENVTTSLSQLIGSDILSNQLHRKQRDFVSFLKEVSKQFTKKRGADFQSKPLSEKKQIDSSILGQVEYCYKLYILDDEHSSLNTNDQRVIVEVLASFCIKFYATDDTGTSVYKYNIADDRSKKRYKDLLDDVSQHHPQGRVPIKLSDPTLEKQEREKMVDLAHKVNKKENLIPGDFSITINDIEFRYTRVIMRQNGRKNDKGMSLSSAIGFQGAQFTYKHRKYQVEKELLLQQGSLLEIAQTQEL